MRFAPVRQPIPEANCRPRLPSHDKLRSSYEDPATRRGNHRTELGAFIAPKESHECFRNCRRFAEGEGVGGV